MSGSSFDVDEKDFERAVIERSKETPVLVDFWAEWCGPCRMLGPLLERLAAEYGGKFLLAKVNVDQSPGLAAEFGVSGIPHVAAIVDGKLAGQFVGLRPESGIREFIDRICPSEAEILARQAAALEATDSANAQELYRKVLQLEPKHTASRAALAELAYDAARFDEAAQLAAGVGEGASGRERAQNVLARLEFRKVAGESGSLEECRRRAQAAPGDLSAQLAYGLAQAAAGRFGAALETLVRIVEADRDFGSTHAKEAMVKIFGILGQQSELSNQYRGRLANALY